MKENPTVTICVDESADVHLLLKTLLEQSGFWKKIEAKCKKKGVAKKDFSVLIKPDFDHYELDGSTGIDPALVEYLIDLLAERGFTKIVVANSDHASGTWLDNRDALVLADLIGYKYSTPKGISYDIQSLSEQLVDAKFKESGALHGSQLSNTWLEADFRLVFSKNKTDEEFYYSLGLRSLIDILPLKNKDYHYYFRLKAEEVATALLERDEVDFCLIDAYTSNHGMQGSRYSDKIKTATFIASDSLLLADWVGSLKMGLDPYCSPINSYAYKQIGLPAKYNINGDLSVYQGWKNVPLLLGQSVQERNKNPVLKQLAQAWTQTVDTTLFPFRNVADAQVNKLVSPLVKDIDAHPLAYWALLSFNYFLARIQKFADSYHILYEKEKLYRQEGDLGFDLTAFSDKDFEDIEDYVSQLVNIAAFSPPDRNGIKWRYIENSVIFEYKKILPYDYASFVSKVDISQSVQYMFDNIGGTKAAVKKDSVGKIVYQAERDIYLPQPNWMVLFEGKFIDVCKIEVIRYKKTSQAIFWKTVKSLNQSVEYDDGMVSFSSVANKITEVKIVARQKFTLPLFWQVVNIDYLEKIKSKLVSDSYAGFFARTMANFEAVYEGRNPRLGKVPDPMWGEVTPAAHPFEAQQIQNLISIFSGVLQKWIKPGGGNTGKNEAITDEDGYKHFKGDGEAGAQTGEIVRTFMTDFASAMQKDMQYITQGNSGK